MKIRDLKASEIECRVGQIKQNKGLSLLLYKDARVDQAILDETYGADHWQKKYDLIAGNLFCSVGVYSDSMGQWVWKQDVGTESNMEKEKGQASDAFKRAAFCWGIGRELYTAPFIWIPAGKCEIKTGQNGKPACYDRFKVADIRIQDKKITALTIINEKTGETVYRMGAAATVSGNKAPEEEPQKDEKLPLKYVKSLETAAAGKKVAMQSVLGRYRVTKAEDLTFDQYNQAMRILSKM